MMTKQEIKAAIKAAPAIFVGVRATEFYAKISKVEAAAFCEYLGWNVECDVRNEGTYLESADI
jgi:hypothetical protein